MILFEYFERHFAFFSTMLASSGAATFRSRLLAFLIEQLDNFVDINHGINKDLNKDVILSFFGAAIVGIMESYITKGISVSPRIVAEQVGILLNRNL